MFSLEGYTISNRVRSARYISDIQCPPKKTALYVKIFHTLTERQFQALQDTFSTECTRPSRQSALWVVGKVHSE